MGSANFIFSLMSLIIIFVRYLGGKNRLVDSDFFTNLILIGDLLGGGPCDPYPFLSPSLVSPQVTESVFIFLLCGFGVLSAAAQFIFQWREARYSYPLLLSAKRSLSRRHRLARSNCALPVYELFLDNDHSARRACSTTTSFLLSIYLIL